MSVIIQKIGPMEIETESFRIISEELGQTGLDERNFKVVQRVIHATGDFSFLENMRFSADAISTGIQMIRQGKNILTDVNMVAAGISKTLLGKWGGEVICNVANPAVADTALARNKTRSEIAIELGLKQNIGIVAIGNAPTALVQTISSLKENSSQAAPLIVGVPVGFVNAAESKALLVEQNDCYITSLGRKGGSPVAAAIINALLRLADKE
jgi:precorrin-8X/cobalt-precorrin-8 methylmutase